MSALADGEIVRRVLDGETGLYETLMRRYNQRLYRVARAILRDDGEAEDVLQETWVRAYQHLRQFAGAAKFSTWLTRIAVHEALARSGRRRRFADTSGPEDSGDAMDRFESGEPGPEARALGGQARELLEAAVDALPGMYRSVFVLREVEEMSTAETAAALGLTEEAVEVRLHRGRRLLRDELYARTGAHGPQVFRFLGARCDRMVRAVMERIGAAAV